MNEAVVAEHRRVRRRIFRMECSRKYFTPNELRILLEYGSWLKALAYGEIPPFTEPQRRFIEVAHGDASAESDFEKVWDSYQTQLSILSKPHYHAHDASEAWFPRRDCWIRHVGSAA